MTSESKEKKHGLLSWLFKKIANEWVFGEAIIISSGFIIAYAINFHGHGFSTQTEDWADFATYLSGTVGVTAVVATLIVLIRTLGQQDKLIKSQDEMLGEQRKQIENAERYNEVELAYKKVNEFFPVLLNNFNESLTKKTSIYIKNEDDKLFSVNSKNTLHKYFVLEGEQVLTDLFFDDVKRSLKFPLDKVIYRYGPIQFDDIYRICSFMEKMISIDEDLITVFDFYLSRSCAVDKDYWFYVECYRNFQIGRGKESDYPSFSKYDTRGIKEDPWEDQFYKKWREMGESISKPAE